MENDTTVTRFPSGSPTTLAQLLATDSNTPAQTSANDSSTTRKRSNSMFASDSSKSSEEAIEMPELSSKRLKIFQPFPRLPIELRREIYSLMPHLPTRRILIRCDKGPPRIIREPHSAPTELLNISQETRAIALEDYKYKFVDIRGRNTPGWNESAAKMWYRKGDKASVDVPLLRRGWGLWRDEDGVHLLKGKEDRNAFAAVKMEEWEGKRYTDQRGLDYDYLEVGIVVWDL